MGWIRHSCGPTAHDQTTRRLRRLSATGELTTQASRAWHPESPLAQLHEVLAARVAEWRRNGYPCEHRAISEIFEHAVENELDGQPYPASGSLRYLRAAQLRALETYWYLRLVLKTPHIRALYATLFPDPDAHLEALGLKGDAFLRLALREGVAGIVQRVMSDDAFAAEHDLDALRETLTLSYSSYILALAMGAGKTLLIGAIIATEFAMALEYPHPDADGIQFVENALVFAPGKTIIESLRELARVPYDRILPPRLHRAFAATYRITFTRDGDRGIAVVPGSSFNIVVTNTEKIRIQARSVARRSATVLQLQAYEEQERETANRRLQDIASLPHLAVFSDEAHHTYGNQLGVRLKRVRQTVDYLAARSPNLICVVNTTGTPYFRRQPLRDVVVWYGLSQGIADGILKEVAGNIQAFDFADTQTGDFVEHVVADFFRDYGTVSLPDGASAKLAIYFPQTDDIDELRPRVDIALAKIGQPTTIVLVHTSKTGADAEDAFNRLNDPNALHRVMLLVNKGTEGWNCPSLFATALARRLTGNNFVLQAASRCLRQVPGNDRPARIYLSASNRSALDRQLQENYNETIADLDRRARETRHGRIRLAPNKIGVAPLIIRRERRVVRRLALTVERLVLARPVPTERSAIIGRVLEIGPQAATTRLLRAVGDAIQIEAQPSLLDLYSAAVELAATVRAQPDEVLSALRGVYTTADDLPQADLTALAAQLEAQLAKYETVVVDEPLTLRIIKPDGFEPIGLPDGSTAYEAEISYPVDKSDLVFGPEQLSENPGHYGFHYMPYNFDSHPEASYFHQVLRVLNRSRSDVTDVYFIGALTDPEKTDLTFDYLRLDGRPARYTPDFLIRCRDDRWYLAEVKREAARHDPIEGEVGRKAVAVRELVAHSGGRLGYDMVFTASDETLVTDLAGVQRFLDQCASVTP